jgi:hypothetical protein
VREIVLETKLDDLVEMADTLAVAEAVTAAVILLAEADKD